MNIIGHPCPRCHVPSGAPCASFRPQCERGRACDERIELASSGDRVKGPGYHHALIKRGAFGEVSKIEEEFWEFMDALRQGVTVMQLVELSDMLGAIEGWLEKHHPSISLAHLIKMKDVTKRAFKNGHRGKERG